MGLKVEPLDTHNSKLLDLVRPRERANPEPAPRYNLVVIGGGTAGLVAAAGAAGIGARVALVERDLMGGDCLNTGCVPSKALLRSSHLRADLFKAAQLGWKEASCSVEVDFPAVMERLRRIRADIGEHDSVAHFSELGIDVFQGQGRFMDSSTIDVDGSRLRFRKAVIATGARAARAPIPGLEEAGYVTNEDVFNLTELPPRLAVIGGGPIGCELAQAFARLGSEVTIITRDTHFLPREDPDAAAILQQRFEREGIRIVLEATVQGVESSVEGRKVRFTVGDEGDTVTADEILVAVGRAPNVDGLNLEAVGVEYDKRKGITVDGGLRTSNKRIYAAGDVCLPFKFTHMADAAARIVIRNAFFPGRSKWADLVVPWATYTDPEIAHVGMYEADARAAGIEVETFKQPFSSVDRALTDGEEEGFVKIHVKKGTDRLVGATIVAGHAGDMISEITTAIVGKVGLKTLSAVIHPYPTQADAIKQAADAWYAGKLTPRVKKMFDRWFSWTR